MTLKEAKKQVAKSLGYSTWQKFVAMNSDLRVRKMLEQAAEIYCKTEKMRIWQKACESQLQKISEGFGTYNGVPLSHSERIWFNAISQKILSYPRATFDPDV